MSQSLSKGKQTHMILLPDILNENTLLLLSFLFLFIINRFIVLIYTVFSFLKSMKSYEKNPQFIHFVVFFVNERFLKQNLLI